jgi:hypothetical protein
MLVRATARKVINAVEMWLSDSVVSRDQIRPIYGIVFASFVVVAEPVYVTASSGQATVDMIILSFPCVSSACHNSSGALINSPARIHIYGHTGLAEARSWTRRGLLT